MRIWLALAALWPSIAWAEVPTLAVLDLTNHTGDPKFDAAGPGVASVLVSKFSRVDEVKVVERTRISEVMGELELAKSKAVDPSTAAKAGKLLGADYLVLGDLFSLQLPNVVVNLRVVKVETGEVVVSRDVSGEVGPEGKEFFVLIDDLAFEVLDAMQLRLDAADRIEFSQVDVRELKTVTLYGEALKAMEGGDGVKAEGLLTAALALEPGFRLAEADLDALSAAISVRQETTAYASITRTHADMKKLRAKADEIALHPPATLEGVAWLAIRARLMLMEGAYGDYLKAEDQRIEFITANWAALDAASRFKNEAISSEVTGILQREMLDRYKTYFYQIKAVPSDIRPQMAEVLITLGRTDEAATLVVSNYQHPGPEEHPNDRPPSPVDLADRLHLFDLRVVLLRQQLRQAELQGDEDGAKTALHDLDEAVADARKARDGRKEEATVTAMFDRQAPTVDSLWAERTFIRACANDPSLALAGYRGFMKRWEAGYYKSVATDSHFRDVADAWYDVSVKIWEDSWFPDQKMAALLLYHEQAPGRDAAQAAEYHDREVKHANGWFP